MRDELYVTIPVKRYEELVQSERDLTLATDYLLMIASLGYNNTELYYNDDAVSCLLELLGVNVKGKIEELREEKFGKQKEEKNARSTDQCPADTREN